MQKYIIYLWIPLNILIYFNNSSNNFKNPSFLFKVLIDFLTNSYQERNLIVYGFINGAALNAKKNKLDDLHVFSMNGTFF
jgi:hypothetical protein